MQLAAAAVGDRLEHRGGAARDLQAARIDDVHGRIRVVRHADDVEGRVLIVAICATSPERVSGAMPLPPGPKSVPRGATPNPSVTTISVFRPSRSVPRCAAAALMAVTVTWFLKPSTASTLPVHGFELSLLGNTARWQVDPAAALQRVHPIGQRPPIPRELDRTGGRERIHDGHEIGRTERGQHGPSQRGPAGDGAFELADVVLVPEHQEHPHVVTRGFRGGVLLAPYRQGTIVGWFTGVRQERERRDRPNHVVLTHLEVVGRERSDRTAAAIDDGGIDTNDVRSAAEGREAAGRGEGSPLPTLPRLPTLPTLKGRRSRAQEYRKIRLRRSEPRCWRSS